MLTDWLNEERLQHARTFCEHQTHTLSLLLTLSFPLSLSLSFFLSLSLFISLSLSLSLSLSFSPSLSLSFPLSLYDRLKCLCPGSPFQPSLMFIAVGPGYANHPISPGLSLQRWRDRVQSYQSIFLSFSLISFIILVAILSQLNCNKYSSVEGGWLFFNLVF